MTEPTPAKPLTDFEHGYLCAMAQLIRLHDQPSMAADCLHHDGLGALDCRELDEFDKASLRELIGERNMRLTGLESDGESCDD